MMITKNTVALRPSPCDGEMFHVGTMTGRMSGGGLWYSGDAGDEYECHVILSLYKDEDRHLRIFVVPERRSYNPAKVGLIYTDPGFLRYVRAFLKELGLPAWSKVDYSEQGMQGDNFVDMEMMSERAVKWLKQRLAILGVM